MKRSNLNMLPAEANLDTVEIYRHLTEASRALAELKGESRYRIRENYRFYSHDLIRIFYRLFYVIWFVLYFNYPSQAQVWQLSKPAEGAPGFVRGYGENVYVGGGNDPGLRLTRSGSAVKPTVVLSETNYPGRSQKYLPIVAISNAGNALVFWVDGGERIWKARQIDTNGVPQGDEITLSDIPTQGFWLRDLNWVLSSNGDNIVFVWHSRADIHYQLFDFSGIAITTVKQANQDTTVIDALIGQWYPGAYYPSAYMRDDGNFIIAWQDERNAEMKFDVDIFYPSGDVGEIYARKFDRSGEPIGDNFRVNQDSIPRIQTHPAVAMNEAGTILCYWLERDTANVNYSMDMVRGRVLGDSFAIDHQGSGNKTAYVKPSVTASASGFAALWQQNDSLFVQAFDDSGNGLWHARNANLFRVSEFAVRTMDDLSYALVWSYYSSPSIQGRILNSSDGALGRGQIIAAEKSFGTKIGVADRGLAVSYLSTSNTAVNVALLNDNLQPQHQIERVNTDFGGARHEEPDGVQMADGNYLAVWSDGRNDVLSIYGQIFNSDGDKTGGNFPLYVPAEHSNHQTPSLASHPLGGAVLAYRSQTNSGAKHGAWLRRISHDGSLVDQPVRVDHDTGEFIWDVKVAILPTQPFTVLATWREWDRILGKVFDSDLNALSQAQELATTEGEFNLYADKQNHFWLILRDYHTENVYLRGFDGSLLQFSGPTQLNDSTLIVKANLPRMAFLDNGTMLSVWATSTRRSTRIDGIYAQVLASDGTKIDDNFRISSRLVNESSVIGFSCSAKDTFFTVSWNSEGKVGIVWLNQDGKLARVPTSVSHAGVFYDHKFFFVDPNRLLFLHRTSGDPNITDISVNLFEPTAMNTSGWYSSPIFTNQDSLSWKKLHWQADTPANTNVRVFFRCRNDLRQGDTEHVPWQGVDNGQTQGLPSGKNAQWRVELQGTEKVSPVVHDLIGEYDLIVGISPSLTPVPHTFKLDPLYPNPARFQVTLAYELPATSAPTITLYNVLGQQINEWKLPQQTAGRHTFRWNGENKYGSKVANGIYFIKLEVNHFRAVRKIAFFH